MNPLIQTITGSEPLVRDRSIQELLAGLSTDEVLRDCDELETFRQDSRNLYERVRASMFLHCDLPLPAPGLARPPLGRRDPVRRVRRPDGAPVRAGHHRVPLDRTSRWPERLDPQRPGPGLRADHLSDPRRPGPAVGPELQGEPLDVPGRPGRRASDPDPSQRSSKRSSDDGLFPILIERTPVRLDLSHSAWSDIFFLGMDYPEGARVLNISVDLGVHGRDDRPIPPIETRVRVISEPLLRLTSIDLNACKDVTTLDELFNFGNDYLGLVKAGVIASGLVPASLEGTAARLDELLASVVRPGSRAGGREQGQRHPQGVAAGGLDEPAGLADLGPDEGDLPGPEPDRPARSRGGAGGRRSGDPRRMAGRVGRRLAGFGRGLSRA